MGKQGKRGQHSRMGGYTIIEVMMFFAVTGLLMLGVLGTASVGVNGQRYTDAVNTFQATVQQEFTNATNVINTESTTDLCSSLSGDIRGTSNCVIIGRLMTVDDSGDVIKSNLIGTAPPADAMTSDTEIKVIADYQPFIDTTSQERSQMSWGTRILKNDTGSSVSLLIVRSPRSGNVYSYVRHSGSIITNTDQLQEYIAELVGESVTANPANSSEQYMCVDRSGWVLTPVRVITLAAYASGPSGVGSVEEGSGMCD